MNFAEQIMTAPLGKTHLFFVGQAGYIIKSKTGTLLAVDLYLTDCVEHLEGHAGFKRLTPKVLDPDDIVFDYVVATHPHYDHFDVDAMPTLMAAPKTQLVASVNCRQEAERLQLPGERITYAQVGDCCQAGDIRLDMTACDHGDGAPDAFGLMITVDGHRIYMMGDTCLRTDHLEAIRQGEPVELLIGPINGEFGNLNEQEFVTACEMLHPKLAIPCHFWTCPSHGGDPKRFRELIEAKLPEQEYLFMALCERYTF